MYVARRRNCRTGNAARRVSRACSLQTLRNRARSVLIKWHRRGGMSVDTSVRPNGVVVRSGTYLRWDCRDGNNSRNTAHKVRRDITLLSLSPSLPRRCANDKSAAVCIRIAGSCLKERPARSILEPVFSETEGERENEGTRVISVHSPVFGVFFFFVHRRVRRHFARVAKLELHRDLRDA